MHYKPEIVSAYFVECGLPKPEFEFTYIPNRKFRMDVGWPLLKVGIEVMGGLWIKAAHSTGTGIKRDMEKRNLGILAGWRVLECEPKDICTLDFVNMVKALLATTSTPPPSPQTGT
jgi:hypothetical protein